MPFFKPKPTQDELDAATLRACAAALSQADALLIGTGAGMGVDSGLPDFRSKGGLWGQYPLLNGKTLDVIATANPSWFRLEPEAAWGFYGHRLELYRQTTPHAGFDILRRWSERMRLGSFVFTSNVDNHFQRAGFARERIYEVHGSLCWMQCERPCGIGLFSSEPFSFEVGPELRLTGAPPRCPSCGSRTRPNVVLYGDETFDPELVHAQRARFRAWRERVRGKSLCIIELGAGAAIPTVRQACEDAHFELNGTLIRINVHAPEGPDGTLSLGGRALDMLQRLDALLPA